MSSEWMKVMLDEIARKKAEAEQDQRELERRSAEHRNTGHDGTDHEVEPAPTALRQRSV
jgi:hypothetical protein